MRRIVKCCLDIGQMPLAASSGLRLMTPSVRSASIISRTTQMIFTVLQVLFNFRADRMVEISKAFEYEEFGAFDRKRWPKVRCFPSGCPFDTLQ
jgi:BPG-independent PGAM N-terminus (iPGM_N)